MDFITNWIDYLALHFVLLIGMCLFQVFLNKKFKKRTEIVEIFSIQLGLPFGIMIAIQFLAFSPLGLVLQVIMTFLVFAALNYSEYWYRQQLDFKGEKHVTLCFRETKPDSGPVNVYESRRLQKSEVAEILEKNLDALIRLSDRDEFLLDVIGEYVKLTPADKTTLTNYKKLKTESEAVIPDNIEAMERAEAKQKKLVLEIFQKIYQKIHFHVLYFSWYFMLDLEESYWDLNDNIRALIISPEAKLPDTLTLNCSVLLENERLYGKKFTTLFCIHGEQNEEYIRKTDQFVNYLPIFSHFHQFAESEADKLELEYLRDKNEDLINRFTRLSQENMTIEQQIEDNIPKQERKRKKRLRFKTKEDYYE